MAIPTPSGTAPTAPGALFSLQVHIEVTEDSRKVFFWTAYWALDYTPVSTRRIGLQYTEMTVISLVSLGSAIYRTYGLYRTVCWLYRVHDIIDVLY